MRAYIILIFSALIMLTACRSGQISRGDAAYDNMAYKKAIKHYEKAMNGKKDPALHAKIAASYGKMNNTAKAEEHYSKALETENADAAVKLAYAKALMANGKKEAGLDAMVRYLDEHPEDANAREWALKSTKEGEFSEYHESRVKVELLDLPNFTAAFSPCPYKEYLYFTAEKNVSTDEKPNPWNGKSFLDIYRIRHASAFDLNSSESVGGQINTLLHDGPIAVDSVGQYAYVTQSALKKNNKRMLDEQDINQLKISVYKIENNGEWKLSGDLLFNESNSSTMHPSITEDGRTLFFSSDRHGGAGSADLYMVSYNGTEWGEPVSLGADINTPGNEVFPFARHKDTVFFASNGHGGMGGLDIFMSVFDGQKWSHPQNLKSPINTHFDDFSIYRNMDGKSGFFSSNRTGKDQIYSWEVRDPQFLIVGKVVDIDKDPVDHALVMLSSNNPMDSILTDPNGNFEMPLDWNRDYEISGKSNKLFTDTFAISTMGLEKSDTFRVELNLQGPEFLVRGYVIDKNSKLRLSDVNVELLNADETKLNVIKTGASGEFSFKLNRNEQYSIYGNKKKYFTRMVAVSTVGLKESKTFEVVLELEEVKEKTTIVLNNIYYDFDKWFIRKDAVGDLDNLLRFMKDNPGTKIEMSSHTDSRGTNTYNLDLSDKRAKSAMDYLIERGVGRDRMQFKGYGETKLVNGCKDGVICTEAKHQANRRTEFTVLKLD
jgi:outer membrane protein OmpA-like peptidoglycan-associated protein/tetratricopeptide (TPR) repeat protein